MDYFWADFLIVVFVGFAVLIVLGFLCTLRDLYYDARSAFGAWSDRREMRRRHRQIFGRQ